MSTPTSSSSPEPGSESSQSPSSHAPSGQAEASAVAGSAPGERAAVADERGGEAAEQGLAAKLGSPGAAGMLPDSVGFRRPVLYAVGFSALLLLLLGLRLSSDGLWDPYEVRYLEQVSDPSNPIAGQPLWQPMAGNRSRILLWPLALGSKLFGFNELGARLPMWVLAGLSVLSLAGFAAWQRRRWGAFLAPLLLATTPLFFMSARLASQALLPLLAQIWAVWGLAMLVSSGPASRRWNVPVGLLLTAAGLVVGGFACGTVVGVGVPTGAVAMAWLLRDGAGGTEAEPEGWQRLLVPSLLGLAFGLSLLPLVRLIVEHSATLPGTPASNPTTLRLQIAAAALVTAAAALVAVGRRSLPMILAALAIAVGVLPAGPAEKMVGFSPWLAGSLHYPGTREVQVDTLLRGLGFAFFPWSALLPAAIAGLFTGSRSSEHAFVGATATAATPDVGERGALSFLSVLALCWFALSYLLITLHNSLVVELPFLGLPAAILLVTGYIERLLRDDRAGGVLAGVCVGLCALIVGRDFFFSPELFLSGAFGEPLRWPSPMAWVGQVMLGAAVVFGGLFALTLFARGRWRARGWLAIAGLAVLTTALSIHGLCPNLSRHVSYRGLYTRYRQLGGGKLALFSVQQASGKIYGQEATQLYSLPDLMSFLAGQSGERTFAIVGAGELGGIDREAHLRGLQYYVVDDSNAQYSLLSNRLLPGEEDLNPLRRLVSSIPPQPRVPVHVTFDERIELVGYDAPPEINRGEELVIRLYYRVLASVSMNYRVFLHFDGPGARFNGDHTPVGGKFQTTYWSPGTYITDEYRMPIGRMSQAAGYYQIFTGFWPGGDGPRMTVTSGPHEADQRVRIGAIRVK